jgi:hypothetical protein
MEVQRAKDREMQIQVALLRRDLINFSFCRPKKEVKLEQLLPPDLDTGTARPKRMTAKRRAAVADRIREAMGAFIKR